MAPNNRVQSGYDANAKGTNDGASFDPYEKVETVENAHDRGTPQQYGSSLVDNATWPDRAPSANR